MTKRLPLTGLAGALSILSVLAMPVQAGDAVRCTFIVEQDAALNVKPGMFRTRRIVNAAAFEQMVPSAEDAAVVTAFRENECRLQHAVDSRVEVFVNKNDMKLDPEGNRPACEDLKVKVLCNPS